MVTMVSSKASIGAMVASSARQQYLSPRCLLIAGKMRRATRMFALSCARNCTESNKWLRYLTAYIGFSSGHQNAFYPSVGPLSGFHYLQKNLTIQECFMNLAKLAAIFAVGILAPAVALAATCNPLTGANNAYNNAGAGCNDIITISSTGVVSVSVVNSHPYDGTEDQYVGVINNSSNAITALTLTGPNSLFGFDGDGIDTFGITGNASDTSHGNTGYGGTDAFFTGINGSKSVGTVNFVTAIAAGGGTQAFSLELDPSSGTFTGTVAGQTPEPSGLILLGTGALGLAANLRRRFAK
jgi:PEP-CTERM motif